MSVRQPKKSEQTESIQLMRKISNMESTTHVILCRNMNFLDYIIFQNEVESSLNLESIRQENVGWRLYYWMIDHVSCSIRYLSFSKNFLRILCIHNYNPNSHKGAFNVLSFVKKIKL